MKTSKRLERLENLRKLAITSVNSRSTAIEIAYNREMLDLYKDSTDGNEMYFAQMVKADLDKNLKRYAEIQKRVPVGQMNVGGVWGGQIVYLYKSEFNDRICIGVENVPSGWYLDDVMGQDIFTFDGGQGWAAVVPDSVWGKVYEVIHLDLIKDVLR